jgi:transposase InsO family protein
MAYLACRRPKRESRRKGDHVLGHGRKRPQMSRRLWTALTIWKDDYNTVRPHSALGNLPPAVFAELSVPGMQRDGALR